MKPFVAVYARVSTRGQSDALEDQLLDTVSWAASRYPDRTIRSYQDIASRDNPRRSGWLTMLREISAGECVAVVAKDLTRLCSGMSQVADLASRMGDRTELVMVDGRFDFRGPGGRIMLAVLAELAAWELESIRKRIRAGIKKRSDKGLPIGRTKRKLPRTLDEYHRLVTVEGRSVSGLAAADDVPRATLGRHLREYRAKLATPGDPSAG